MGSVTQEVALVLWEYYYSRWLTARLDLMARDIRIRKPSAKPHKGIYSSFKVGLLVLAVGTRGST